MFQSQSKQSYVLRVVVKLFVTLATEIISQPELKLFCHFRMCDEMNYSASTSRFVELCFFLSHVFCFLAWFIWCLSTWQLFSSCRTFTAGMSGVLLQTCRRGSCNEILLLMQLIHAFCFMYVGSLKTFLLVSSFDRASGIELSLLGSIQSILTD